MAGLAEVLQHALRLDVHDRATLAERLLASLDDLSEEEAERLWAEEARRRLDGYRAGHAKAVRAEEVHEKVGRLLPIIDEVYAVRAAIAKASDDDLDKIAAAARARQAKGGRPVVRLPARRPSSVRKVS